MDAQSYMNEIVDPTIGDFEVEPTSRRRAFLACVATFHCIDYLTHPKKSKIIRREFQKNRSFAVVDRVAHAFKHVASGNRNAPYNPPLDVAAVFSRPPMMAGRAECGVSQCGDTVGGIAIWGEGDSDLLLVVKDAAEFLRTKMRPE